MKYETFQQKVSALVERAGGGIGVGFSEDTDKGKFIASFSDGTIITGNSDSLKVTVNFGSCHEHQAMATI